MRIMLVVMACLAACGCSNPSPQGTHAPVRDEALFPRKIPLGKLGHPLGTALTIEGVRQKHGKCAGGFLVVDTVNGQKLAKPVSVWFQNLKNPVLPAEVRCVFGGYETGSMVGDPPALLKDKGRLISPNQLDWQFWRTFVITSVVEPKSVEVKGSTTMHLEPISGSQ